MRKVLELLLFDFQDFKPPYTYWRLNDKVREVEDLLLASLSDEQKKMFSKLETLNAERDVMSQNFLAEFLFEQIRNIFIGGGA